MSKQYEQTVADRLLSHSPTVHEPQQLAAQKLLQMNAVQRYRFDRDVVLQAHKMMFHPSFPKLVETWFRLPCSSVWFEAEVYNESDNCDHPDPRWRTARCYSGFLAVAADDPQHTRVFAFDYDTVSRNVSCWHDSTVTNSTIVVLSPRDEWADAPISLFQSLAIILTMPRLAVACDVRPPARLQAARKHRGQLPFVSYKTISLNLAEPKQIYAPAPPDLNGDVAPHRAVRRRRHPVDLYSRLVERYGTPVWEVVRHHHRGDAALGTIIRTKKLGFKPAAPREASP